VRAPNPSFERDSPRSGRAPQFYVRTVIKIVPIIIEGSSMEFLYVVGGIAAVLILPVKYMGQYFCAERTGIGSCIIAIIIGLAFAEAGRQIHEYGEYFSIFLSALGFSLVLGTSYIKGMGIALVQIVVIVLAALVAAGLGFGEITIAS
jgi:hypothetical protein